MIICFLRIWQIASLTTEWIKLVCIVINGMIGKSLKRFLVICRGNRVEKEGQWISVWFMLCEDSRNVPGGSLFIVDIINLVLHCLVSMDISKVKIPHSSHMITCDNVFGSCRTLWFEFILWNLCRTIKVGAARG